MTSERSIDLPGRPLRILPAQSSSRRPRLQLLGLLTAAALMVVARRLAGRWQTPRDGPTC